MFSRKIVIHLRDTDATGVIYFAEQLRMAQETLEFFLQDREISLREILEKQHFLLPIVHAQSDYLEPIFVGDEITIDLTVKKVGTTSFTLAFSFEKEGRVAGRVELIHVVVDQKSRQSIPIPSLLLTHLEHAALAD